MAAIPLTSAPSSTQPGPTGATPTPLRALDTTAVFPAVGGSIATVRAEVDDAYADMKGFHNLDPDDVMRLSGGHSARLSELRVRIMRIEDFHRQWKPVRVREVEVALDQLAHQYSIASRRHSVREFDWKMEQGER